MTTPLDDRAAAERRAWADDEVKIYQPGESIPPPPPADDDDEEGDDEE